MLYRQEYDEACTLQADDIIEIYDNNDTTEERLNAMYDMEHKKP